MAYCKALYKRLTGWTMLDQEKLGQEGSRWSGYFGLAVIPECELEVVTTRDLSMCSALR